VSEQTKKCSKCGVIKAKTEFYKKKASKDGVKPECKVCQSAYSAKYRAENREKVKARHAKYRAENREKVKAREIKYRAENRERLSVRDAKYKKDNLEKGRVYTQRRRARKANAQGDYTAEQLKARFDYHGNRCVYCDSTEDLHADHQIPLSRGGTNFASNMVPACATCNKSKGAKTPEEFLVQQFNIAMEKLING